MVETVLFFILQFSYLFYQDEDTEKLTDYTVEYNELGTGYALSFGFEGEYLYLYDKNSQELIAKPLAPGFQEIWRKKLERPIFLKSTGNETLFVNENGLHKINDKGEVKYSNIANIRLLRVVNDELYALAAPIGKPFRWVVYKIDSDFALEEIWRARLSSLTEQSLVVNADISNISGLIIVDKMRNRKADLLKKSDQWNPFSDIERIRTKAQNNIDQIKRIIKVEKRGLRSREPYQVSPAIQSIIEDSKGDFYSYYEFGSWHFYSPQQNLLFKFALPGRVFNADGVYKSDDEDNYYFHMITRENETGILYYTRITFTKKYRSDTTTNE